MRISDWSSDVCSSDLARSCRADVRQGGHADGGARRLQRDPACRAARGRRVGLHAPRLCRQGAEELAKDLRRRSEEHTSELQSLMRISYAVFCLKKKRTKITE